MRSSGPNITIKFEGDGPELMRAASDVSGIVITGSDGDDSLEVSDGLGVLVRYDGDAGVDALVMPSSGATVHFTGSRAGELFDRFGALLVSFAGVDDVIGGPGEDTFVATAQSDLRSLQMGPGDRFVVELEPGTDGPPTANLLTVDSVDLAGTLDVSGGTSAGLTGSTPVPFLSFGTAQGDFTSFRGLDLGDGAYVRPTTVAGGYELRAAELPDGIAIRFPSATDADEFFTFLSGKGNAFRSGTPVTIQLRDHELTGALAVSGTPETAILTVTDARLRFGGGHDALLTLEDDVATLTLTESKLSGTLDGSLTTTVPDVSFAGTFAVTLDSDGRSIEAVGDDVTVTIAGYTFSGVDVVVTVVGDGAHMALLITGPTGAAVLIPLDGTSGLHAGVLAAALRARVRRVVDASLDGGCRRGDRRFRLRQPRRRHDDRVVAREHRSQCRTAVDDRCTAIAQSGRRCGVDGAPHARPAARPRRRCRAAGRGRVDLHGPRRHVAPRTCAAGRGSRCGTRAPCTEIDRRTARRSVRSGRGHHDRPGTRATRRQRNCHRLRDPRSSHVFPPADPRSPGPLPRDHHQPHGGCVGRVRKG